MDSVKGLKGKCGAEASPVAGPAHLDLDEVREKLRQKNGPELWRSLDELAETPAFMEMLHREFPRHATELKIEDGVSRRRFLQLASASLALAGLTGCTRQPVEQIVPYVRQPEQLVPGRPLFFATAVTLGGYAQPVLAESHQGRPIKVEGNPDHPASLGATDAFTQASILTLYDPERSQTLTENGRLATWGGFVTLAAERVRALQAAGTTAGAAGGGGFRILTGTVTSPTLTAQIQDLLTRIPGARWHQWEAAGGHHERVAAQRAFGAPLAHRYDFTRARVVVTLDADPLVLGPGNVRYSRDFAAQRKVRANRKEMNRLYAVESVASGTGSLADHRLQLPPAEVEAFALALARALGVSAAGNEILTDERARRWVQEIANDLRAHRGASLVVADEYSSPALQVLAHAMNQALGNAGTTVLYTQPVESSPTPPAFQAQSLAGLVRDMNAGAVEMLLILGVNPVYTAPVDLNFLRAFQKVPLRIHSGLYNDETAEYCHWHIPAAHELEGWSDARAFDGTVSIIQPLIEPLFQGKTAHEVLAALAGRSGVTGYELVRETWSRLLVGDFEQAWRQALNDGFVANTQLPPTTPAVNGGAVQQAAGEILQRVQRARSDEGQVTLLFRPDPTIWDGAFAGNAWLQELPKPISKLTWDNALMLSPRTAERLKLKLQEVAEISWRGRKLRAAVWVQPGQADDTAVLTLGYGRRRAGRGTGQGFNAYALRTSDSLWMAPGIGLRGTGESYVLASTQNHHVLESGTKEIPVAMREAERRHVVRTGTLREFQENQDFIKEHREKPANDMTMYPQWKYEGYRWGMAIDLNVCTGCSSCVVACQAENNVPVVGKDQVLAGREMHWLRVDRYFQGDIDEPLIHNQPLPCMHCENAPCEVVCPVAATVHSDEGLNDMVYNRCVGTRYCSNNCPYKVRRFNFFRYADKASPTLAMQYNPDVTVRMRGVMEKCTYCVQRIEQAKIESKVDGQPIPPNRLQTACQQACPTGAIVFGDLNDEAWEVTRWQNDPLNYGLLEEINTRPRTTYLAKLRNPNPALEPVEQNPERSQDGHA